MASTTQEVPSQALAALTLCPTIDAVTYASIEECRDSCLRSLPLPRDGAEQARVLQLLEKITTVLTTVTTETVSDEVQKGVQLKRIHTALNPSQSTKHESQAELAKSGWTRYSDTLDSLKALESHLEPFVTQRGATLDQQDLDQVQTGVQKVAEDTGKWFAVIRDHIEGDLPKACP